VACGDTRHTADPTAVRLINVTLDAARGLKSDPMRRRIATLLPYSAVVEYTWRGDP
jgi:hypothetical protein